MYKPSGLWKPCLSQLHLSLNEVVVWIKWSVLFTKLRPRSLKRFGNKQETLEVWGLGSPWTDSWRIWTSLFTNFDGIGKAMLWRNPASQTLMVHLPKSYPSAAPCSIDNGNWQSIADVSVTFPLRNVSRYREPIITKTVLTFLGCSKN